MKTIWPQKAEMAIKYHDVFISTKYAYLLQNDITLYTKYILPFPVKH